MVQAENKKLSEPLKKAKEELHRLKGKWNELIKVENGGGILQLTPSPFTLRVELVYGGVCYACQQYNFLRVTHIWIFF